jgi:hypothetical protein
MLNKLEEALINLVSWIFYIVSCKEKNSLGASLFLFSAIFSFAAYMNFNPPYDYYGYGFEYGRASLVNILLGRTIMAWIYTISSLGCIVGAIIATYKTFTSK